MFLSILQFVLAIILSIAVLLQNRGTGLGAAFGGEGNVYRTKRGVESFLFKATVVLSVLFLLVSLLNFLY